MKKNMLTFIGMILALVFILIGLIGPWYSVSFMGMSIDVGLFTEATAGIDRGPWDTTMYIAIIACIFAIIGLIGALGLQFEFGKSEIMNKITLLGGILAGIFAFIAPIYLMTSSFMEGLKVGFWNDFGGPGFGWYLMLIGGIIAIIFSIMPMLTKQKS